jgi:hypothetical protein
VITTRAVYRDQLLMFPRDRLQLQLGSGAASVTVIETDAASFYTIAFTLVTLVPGLETTNEIAQVFQELAKDIKSASQAYRACLVGKNWLAHYGCLVKFGSVGKVMLRSAKGILRGLDIIMLFTALADYVNFINGRANSIKKIRESDRTLTQAAQAGKPVGTIKDEGVTIRSGPSDNDPEVARLPAGETGRVLCYSTGSTVHGRSGMASNRWLKIAFDKITDFDSEVYLDIDGNMMSRTSPC